MKTIIIEWYWWIVPLVLILLFLGRTEISIKPFYIRFGAPLLLIGVILLMAGMIFTSMHIYRMGYDHCEQKVKEIMKMEDKKTNN